MTDATEYRAEEDPARPKPKGRADGSGGAAEGLGGAADAACCLAEASFGGLDCFVATAALGRPDHPDLDALRGFRDRWLRRSAAGRLFTRFYYRWGRYPAALIRHSGALRFLVRRGLVGPLAALARRVG
jgi:hypothetical protein